MKLCGISHLASLGSFSFRDIDAVRIRPIGVPLSHPVGTPGRMRNGFILAEDGECEFELKPTAEKQRLVLKPGDLAYIPHGANYRLEATKHPFILSRVSFRLFCGSDEVFFSDSPILVLPDAGFNVRQICAELCSASLPGDNLLLVSLLFRLLHEIGQTIQNCGNDRISRAIAYLDSHFFENTPISTLASICYLSEAQFFRLFRKTTGQTPVDYRNRLRVEQAKRLLLDDELTVGGISELLGFENIYYFDRIFKKYTGTTPTAYRKVNLFS